MVGGANVRNVHAGEGREAAGAKKGGQACNRKHCVHTCGVQRTGSRTMYRLVWWLLLAGPTLRGRTK